MSAKNVLGIDPGASGALALLSPDGAEIVAFLDMPFFEVRGKKRLDVHALGRFLAPHAESSRAVIELVGAMPGQGVSSMFTFGFGVGALHGACGALGMELDTVTPRVWKAAYKLGKDKDESRMLATRRWPRQAALFSRKKDEARAEAALIALWSLTDF